MSRHRRRNPGAVAGRRRGTAPRHVGRTQVVDLTVLARGTFRLVTPWAATAAVVLAVYAITDTHQTQTDRTEEWCETWATSRPGALTAGAEADDEEIESHLAAIATVGTLGWSSDAEIGRAVYEQASESIDRRCDSVNAAGASAPDVPGPAPGTTGAPPGP